MNKKIYLDQMIYIHLLNDPDKFGFGIDELPKKLKYYTLLISMANWSELSSLNNKELDRISYSLDKCKLLYLPMAFHLQDEQLKKYIYQKYFNHPYNIGVWTKNRYLDLITQSCYLLFMYLIK